MGNTDKYHVEIYNGIASIWVWSERENAYVFERKTAARTKKQAIKKYEEQILWE